MRSIGQGFTGLKKFCGIVNMPPPVAESTYNMVVGQSLEATKEVACEVMKLAVLDEINETEETETQEKTDITVSGDGIWIRRGHYNRGEVYNKWLEKHKEICTRNHFESA
ncbi:hypothetical protein J6590_060196 [Homalodisca vitripennis]|nr:hypothetical protein J6590_060196 [Homalodisca vitripennis]